jgi:hypothetical protein
MKKAFISFLVIGMLIFSATLYSQDSRNAASPFPGDLEGSTATTELLLKIATWGIQPYNGGDQLVGLQNNDGGWDWPLDDGNPDSSSPPNTVGPIGMGLAQAYLNTGDTDQNNALLSAGSFLLAKTNNFSPSDGYLAVQLDCIFGGSTFTDHVMNNFYGPLAADTYNRNGAGTLYDTAGYVSLIRTARASQGIPNLAAWDIGMGLVAAAMAGADTTAWIDGVKAEIDELDGNAVYDVIGLAGAVYGLAIVGEDFDPTYGEHASASSLSDLADILAGYQIVSTGGFTWNKNYLNPGEDNETIQETCYALLALNEFDRASYISAILGAADYMRSVQLASGGWKNWAGAGENNEVTGEALWGISSAYPISIAYTGSLDPQPNSAVVLEATSSSLTDGYSGRKVDFYMDGENVGTATTDTSGVATLTISVQEAGVYEVFAAIGCLETSPVFLVVYDPSAGFVTGGGWISSDAGAYVPDPNLEGKATFGFVAKYKKGAEVPSGNTQFQFKVAGLNFQSSSYDWLVVAGEKAKFKGIGTINGSGSYGFMLTAIDGDLLGTPGPDKFRIKITDGETVVYDNKPGASDTGDDATVLGGGSIVIHTGKK